MTQPQKPKRALPLVAVLLGVIVVLGLVAVIATSVSEEDAGNDAIEARAERLAQVQPVDAEGSLPPLDKSGDDPAVGAAMPEVVGRSFDGDRIAITHDGKPKVIFFLAHWCPHCQKEVPVIVDLLEQDGEPEGVDLYSVATSTDEKLPNYPPSEWLEREDWPIAVLADTADGEAAEAFGVSAFPFFVAVNADGEVVARTSGELTPAQIRALFEAPTGG